tara:strand:- start:204 stop:428 length:225 start_codon:yes stop_codon:yes gene_type:complete
MAATHAKVVGVAVGRKNHNNIYVKTKSGRVYRMNPYINKKGVNVVSGEANIRRFVSRIKDMGTIELRYFTKVRG